VSVGATIALGAVLGLALGIIVSVTTEVPIAPEAGLVLGGVVGWLSRRTAPNSSQTRSLSTVARSSKAGGYGERNGR
jgi:hypothetical protein